MIRRLIAILLLGLAGIVGLGMSLCGGAITFAGLAEGTSHGEFPASSMLIISVPSLVIGVLVVFFVGRTLRRRLGRGPSGSER